MDDSEDEPVCPLCLEELDLTDRHFKPCQCGYQICLWCWHQIMEMAEGEGKCPACRTPYDKNKVTEASQALPEDLTELLTEKKQKDKQTKAAVSTSRQHLSSVRVVQRNLVYVIGLPLNIAEEDMLRTNQYFGQYGKIHKISTSRSAAYNAASGPNGPTASAYVNFVREEDALKCIQAVDGAMLEGKLIRACFGTTKYCNSYLKHMPCTNPDCLYLHDIGSHDDSFTKEEMLASKQEHFHNATHPSNYNGKGLPPPPSEASSSAARPLNIPSSLQPPSSQLLHREGSATVGSPGPQAALAASSSWGSKGKAVGVSPAAKLPQPAPPALKTLRPATPSTSAPPPASTSAIGPGAAATGKSSFTPHKPSAAVLSGRVINANAQPPPFIAVASRSVEPSSGTSTGVNMAKTVSAAQAAAAAALAGRPVTPVETGSAPGPKSGLDPTPKQAAAVLAARTSKTGRQVVVAHGPPVGGEKGTAGSVEGAPAGGTAPSPIKTLTTGPIRQGSFVAVAKAAAGVSLGAASKMLGEGAWNASGPSPLAGDSFPTLQAVVSQSNTRPSSAEATSTRQAGTQAEKEAVWSEESGASGGVSGGLGAWGKSLVKTSSNLATETLAPESKTLEKLGSSPSGEESGTPWLRATSSGTEDRQILEAAHRGTTTRPSQAPAALESAPSSGSNSNATEDAFSKAPLTRTGSLRLPRTPSEAERSSLDGGFHFERSAEIPVSRRSSHGDEMMLRPMPGFGAGTGVFVPGFSSHETLSRSSSPQPAGTGVFIPGLSRTSSGGGGSPSWGAINRGMLQENRGGVLGQGGSPNFNRLLGMNMDGGSPRVFRPGSSYEGASPKFYRPGGGHMEVGSPNYGRLGPGYLEDGSPKYGRVGPFQGEGGSPAYGRANGGQLMGMPETFSRPPGQFNSSMEGAGSFGRPGASVPVSRLARLGGDTRTGFEESKAGENISLGVKADPQKGAEGVKHSGAEGPGQTGTVSENEPKKKEPGSPGESSVIADILGMEFDPWADGPLPDPSGLAKILLAEERAKAAAAAAKTLNPPASAARQSRFKFAWESDETSAAEEKGAPKSRFDFAGRTETTPATVDSLTVSASAGVKSRFGFALEGDGRTLDTAQADVRPGTAGSSGAGSDIAGRFSPALVQQTSDSSETSSRPQSGSRPSSRPSTAEEEKARFGESLGVSRTASAAGKPLLPAPPGFLNRGRGAGPSGSQGILPTPPSFSMRPSLNPPLAGVQPQHPAPPPNSDMGFFDPAIMAMGSGKAFEYKPPTAGVLPNSPGEAVSPGLLSILKNLGAPPSRLPPSQDAEGSSTVGSSLPFLNHPPGQSKPPPRQQGFGAAHGPSFQPPQTERYIPGVIPTVPLDAGKAEGFGGRAGLWGEPSRGSGVWGSGQATAVKEPSRAQRGGLSSMMAAIGGGGGPLPLPTFASAVGRGGVLSPAVSSGGGQGANTPVPLASQSSWAAIAAVKTPPATKQDPLGAGKKGLSEGGKGGDAGKQEDAREAKHEEKEKEGFEKGLEKGKEEREKQVVGEVGEGSDGGQDDGEEESGKGLNEEEEKKALRKKEKKLRREREKALAAERKVREAEEAKAREKAASKKEKAAAEKEKVSVEKEKTVAEKDATPAVVPTSGVKTVEAVLGKLPSANGRAKKESGSGPETNQPEGEEKKGEEMKGEGSKKGVGSEKGPGGEKQNANGKKRKDALALDDLGRDELLGEGGEPILQFAKGSDRAPKSPVREKTKIGAKVRTLDERKAAAFEPDAFNAAGFLASMVSEKKGVNSLAKGKKDEAVGAKPEHSHQEKNVGENKNSTPGGVPLGPFGMPVGTNLVFGAGSSEFSAQALGFNLSANQVFPQNWQGSNVNGMAEGIKAGLSLSALLQQQLELQLQQNQQEVGPENVGGKRSRGYGEAPAGGKDFGLPAAAARAAARVFRMAADFVMDDGSGSSNESFSASSGNGRHGNLNRASAFGVNELPDVYQFSATSSAERAVAAAAAWEQGLRQQEGATSNGNAHNPILSQVDALEREVENAREVERKLENKLLEVKQWIDQDDAVLENITSSYAANA